MTKKRDRKNKRRQSEKAKKEQFLYQILVILQSSRGTRWVLLGIVTLSLLAGIITYDPKFSLTGDDAEFIILGKSIANGLGMMYVHGPVPSPTTKYPFGFPAALAAIQFVSPDNYTVMKIMVLLFFALAMPFVYLLSKKYIGVLPALGVTTLTILSPHLLEYSHQIMSEVPYLCVSLLSLFVLRIFAGNKGIFKNTWLITGLLLMMLSYYTRSIGITLVGATVLYFLLQKRYAQAIFLATSAFILALPWFIRNSNLGGDTYMEKLLLVNPYYTEMGRLTITSLIERVKTNLGIYLLQGLPRLVLPSLSQLDTSRQTAIKYLLTSGIIILVGGYALIRYLRQKDILALYFIFFFGICLLWPQVWSDIRFILPVVPLIWFFLVSGASDLIGHLNKYSRFATGLLGSLIFIVLLSSNISGVFALERKARSDYPPEWRNYVEAGRWIKKNTPKESIICCRKEPMMYIISGRRTAGYSFSDNPRTVISGMEENKVDFVVADQLGFSSTPRYLIPAINKFQDRFQIVYVLHNPETYVLEFKRS